MNLTRVLINEYSTVEVVSPSGANREKVGYTHGANRKTVIHNYLLTQKVNKNITQTETSK